MFTARRWSIFGDVHLVLGQRFQTAKIDFEQVLPRRRCEFHLCSREFNPPVGKIDRALLYSLESERVLVLESEATISLTLDFEMLEGSRLHLSHRRNLILLFLLLLLSIFVRKKEFVYSLLGFLCEFGTECFQDIRLLSS